jgi:hypothetical protein
MTAHGYSSVVARIRTMSGVYAAQSFVCVASIPQHKRCVDLARARAVVNR